jgi:hypothetical protein
VTESFPAAVDSLVGPLLDELGFKLDEVDDNIDVGGRHGSVVFYRSRDCKVQISQSSREGSVKCMIAPLRASNAFGLYDESGEWQYLNEFRPAPDLSLEDLVKSVSYKSKSDGEQLAEVRDAVAGCYAAAHAAIVDNGEFK